MNPHESRARAIKTGRILAAIDLLAGSRAEGDDALIVVAWLEGLDADGWERLAEVAHCRPPSVATRVMVIELVRARARRVA